MNKLITKIVGIALGLTMAAGAGVAVATNNKNIAPAKATTWTKVTSLSAGDIVVFAYEGTKNYELTSISTIGAATEYATVGQPAGTYELTVEVGSSNGSYAFKNGTSYISKGSNKGLSTSSTKNNNSSWTINVGTGDNAGKVKLPNAGSATDILQFNSSSPRFCNYTSSQSWFVIYKKAGTPASGISLSSSNFTPVDNVITVNLNSASNSDTLTPTVTPAGATDKSVSWSSNNTNVATVNNGSVSITTSAEGEATITASANGGTNVTATMTYRVVDNRVLTNVSKDADPTKKTGYTDGDVLDVTGMQVYAYWDSVKDTSNNLAANVVWANGGVLSEGQTEITGYIPKDTNEDFPITITGLSVSAPIYDNTFNLKGNYVISHTKNSVTYYLQSNGTSSAPSPVTDIDDATVFTLRLVDNDTFTFKTGNDYLYANNANDGIRVGDGTDNKWKITTGTKETGAYNLQSTVNNRRLTLYNTQDFRCYVNADTNRSENTDLTPIKDIKSFDVVAGDGAQTRFLKNSPFNYSTAKYTAQITYDDNTTEDVSSLATWTLDTSTIGTNKTLTVTYLEYSDSVENLEVYVITAVSLSIDASQATTTFVKDSSLDTTGLLINGLDENSQVIIEGISPSMCSFSPTTLDTVGQQTITVNFVNEDESVASGTYSVTVENNTVTSLSWTKRPGFSKTQSNYQNIFSGETTLGAVISSNGSDGAGVFTPTWKYAKEDTPSYGTGAHQVHIGLYDNPAPTSEGEALGTDYVFTLNDNGKYVVAFYEGKASSSNKQLNVVKWRSVIDDYEFSEKYDFSDGGSCVKSGNISDSLDYEKTSGSTTAESDSLRLGSNSAGAVLSFSTTSTKLTRVIISAKQYSDSEKTMYVNSESFTLTDSFETYELILSNVTSFTVSSSGSKARFRVASVTMYSQQTKAQIGKTDDCLGLESFIDSYLHWTDYHSDHITGDDTGDGSCTSYYYGDNNNGAKAAFNALNSEQRRIFTTNSAYAAEWARLSAWASANGETLNAQHELGTSPRIILVTSKDNVGIIAVLTISFVSLTAVGGYFLLRKKKEDK